MSKLSIPARSSRFQFAFPRSLWNHDAVKSVMVKAQLLCGSRSDSRFGIGPVFAPVSFF